MPAARRGSSRAPRAAAGRRPLIMPRPSSAAAAALITALLRGGLPGLRIAADAAQVGALCIAGGPQAISMPRCDASAGLFLLILLLCNARMPMLLRSAIQLC